MTDGLATERWIDEGGHLAPEAVIEREVRSADRRAAARRRGRARPRVVIAGDDSTISSRALWWPPNKLSARYVAPYLSRHLGEAADVMPPTPMHRPSTAEHPLERSAS